jgi:hypothetical protein
MPFPKSAEASPSEPLLAWAASPVEQRDRHPPPRWVAGPAGVPSFDRRNSQVPPSAGICTLPGAVLVAMRGAQGGRVRTPRTYAGLTCTFLTRPPGPLARVVPAGLSAPRRNPSRRHHHHPTGGRFRPRRLMNHPSGWCGSAWHVHSLMGNVPNGWARHFTGRAAWLPCGPSIRVPAPCARVLVGRHAARLDAPGPDSPGHRHASPHRRTQVRAAPGVGWVGCRPPATSPCGGRRAAVCWPRCRAGPHHGDLAGSLSQAPATRPEGVQSVRLRSSRRTAT